MGVYCDKKGFSSITSGKDWGHTYGSVPFDLESYTCAGVARVFSTWDIFFYYTSSILFFSSLVLFVFFLFCAITEDKSVQSNLF